MNIETTRLLLCPISDEKMQHLIEEEKDDMMRQALTEMLLACRDFPEKRVWYALWQMELKEKPGVIVGRFCFKGVNENGVVEIGYGLHDGFCGNGYMTEALNAVAEWALQQAGVEKIIAETDYENESSKKVLQRTGFRFFGENGVEGPIYERK